jgi:two-component system, chemotaxis family, chemotaxis protein CheY
MVGKRAQTQTGDAQAPAVANTAPAVATTRGRMFAREVPALDLSAISLFVINDNEFVRSYMERLFAIMRVGRVVTCADPLLAQDAIKDANPDIVLIDLDLTGLDGLELVRRIRRGELGVPKNVAILVASAFVDRDYVMKARNSGTNWTLVKPLTFRRLYEGLARVIMDERPFVETEAYTGPDRRLLVGIAGYDGFERRKERKQ